MSDRDRFQALMLEHLYGLLDADEARELDAYLATPEGAGLRVEAEGWKGKLAGAALVPFLETHFRPPARRAQESVRPAASAPAAVVTQSSVWMRWAVAACLLVVFGGLGGPAAYQFVAWNAQSAQTDELRVAMKSRQEDVRKAEAEQTARREQVKKEHEQAVVAQKAAEQAYRDALAAAKTDVDRKEFLVRAHPTSGGSRRSTGRGGSPCRAGWSWWSRTKRTPNWPARRMTIRRGRRASG